MHKKYAFQCSHPNYHCWWTHLLFSSFSCSYFPAVWLEIRIILRYNQTFWDDPRLPNVPMAPLNRIDIFVCISIELSPCCFFKSIPSCINSMEEINRREFAEAMNFHLAWRSLSLFIRPNLPTYRNFKVMELGGRLSAWLPHENNTKC